MFENVIKWIGKGLKGGGVETGFLFCIKQNYYELY